MQFIFKYIAAQFGNPTGLGGKFSTFIMNRLNQKQYNAVMENMDIQKTDFLLDIGFGNGYLISRLRKKNPKKIYGIEISEDMLHWVSAKNRKAIEQQKIELLLADVQALPFENSSIDKACTVNTVYFWQDISKSFAEIKRVLKPNSIFINVLYAKQWLDKLPMTQYGFSKYTLEEIENLTRENGFKIEQVFEIERQKSICIIAKKEE